VLLSTKDLKYQIARRHTKKFTKCFVGPYKVKAIISSNAIELELPSTVRMRIGDSGRKICSPDIIRICS